MSLGAGQVEKELEKDFPFVYGVFQAYCKVQGKLKHSIFIKQVLILPTFDTDVFVLE